MQPAGYAIVKAIVSKQSESIFTKKDSEVELRKQQGLCPTCGEKGFFSNFAFVCTKHGPY